jgi:hypothetical protein
MSVTEESITKHKTYAIWLASKMSGAAATKVTKRVATVAADKNFMLEVRLVG